MARVGFDTTLVSAYLLARDAKRMTEKDIRDQLSVALSGTELDMLIQISLRDERYR